jgi:hypothetical protein
VLLDSPGWKAEIEPGDVILNVDGFPLGIIDG